MFYKKSGFPEEDEIVLCSVTKVQYHSVFARLDEYGLTGMIHISEVSPGRIRNIRDFVKEDKVIVCKVLKVNKERGYIDLSLRRVGEGQRRSKINMIKQEQKAEKIIETIAKARKIPADKLYKDLKSKIFEYYPDMYSCFKAVIEDLDLKDLGIEKSLADELEVIIRDRLKPPVLKIGGELTLSSILPNGVEIVKSAVLAAQEAAPEVVIRYAGAGKFNVEIESIDYKEAEITLKKAMDAAIAYMQEYKSKAEFVKKSVK